MVTYEEWLTEVETVLGSQLAEPLDVAEVHSLAELRGDEPQDAYHEGDTPREYAEFLIAEWKLFGPEGE